MLGSQAATFLTEQNVPCRREAVTMRQLAEVSSGHAALALRLVGVKLAATSAADVATEIEDAE